MNVRRRIVPFTASLAAVGGIVIAGASFPHVHVATVILVLLLAILLIARRWGFTEAALATGLGAALLDYYFLPPAGWGIETAEHWLVFVSFLIVALIASHLAAQAKNRAEVAIARHRELERLDAFSRDLPMDGSPGSVVTASLDSLVRNFPIEGAAFYDHSRGEIACSGAKGNTISADLLRGAVSRAGIASDKSTDSLLVAIRCDEKPVGSLAVCGGGISELTFRAIADRLEAMLDTVLAQEKARHADEARRHQELKAALLDSLGHEIKTPLSVIKTAVTSLLSRDSDVATRAELLSIINQETDRLDASISEVFWTARLEAGALQSGKGPHDMGPLVSEVLSELGTSLGDRPVGLEIPGTLPPAHCDLHMIKGVLKELLTNALKYSPPGSPLSISVQHAGDEIVTTVADCGIGIKPEEKERMFEKYYRGSVQAPGTGLGLAFARTIVEAHGGRIWVESQPGAGAVFYFSLPASRQDIA
ncbi:MAG TPA: ATP-binding protein [Candidatus Eisenbacteria bacterium]|nr:ATP-binding protein [Candidatus Eisenbacteria bacterium]